MKTSQGDDLLLSLVAALLHVGSERYWNIVYCMMQ